MKSRSKFKIICLILSCYIFLSTNKCFAQPANNTCATAATLTYNGACATYTNTSSNTTSDGISSEPTCWQGGASDWNESVWFKVVLPAGQTSLVANATGAGLATGNIAMQIYSGTCGSLTEIGCVLGGGTAGAGGLTPGNTYFIMVDGVGNNDGTFCLSAGAPLVANDFICSSVNLTVGGSCVSGDNTGTTAEGLSAPSCWNGPTDNYSNSIWYSFVATDDSVTVNPGSGTLETNALTAIYSSSNGTCTGTLSQIACSSGGNEANATGLTIGSTYFVMIDGQGANLGSFCVNAVETPPPPPPVGTCVNPRDLYIAIDCDNVDGTQYGSQSNLIFTDVATGGDKGGSMAGYGNPTGLDGSCTGGTSDALQDAYWIRFTALDTDVKFTNGGTATLDYVVFSGDPCSGTATQVLCTSITAGATSSLAGLTANTVYYVMITGNGTTNATTAYLCLTRDDTGDPVYSPSNNTCAGATTLTAGTTYNLSNANATADLNLCSGSIENNIWVKWTAPTSWTGPAYLHLFNQDCACGNGLQTSVYTASASCPPNSGPTCELTLNPNNDNDFFGNFTPVAGSTYYITIDGYAACACAFDLAITSNNVTPIPLPINVSDLEAEYLSNRVILSWKTNSSKAIKHFEIERSYDAFSFETIGKVNNTQSKFDTKYEYIDLYAKSFTAYYRIKQIDSNGDFAYSKIESINISEKTVGNFVVAPNPSKGDFVISTANLDEYQKFIIVIENTLGNKIFEKEISETTTKINLEDIQNGIYFVKIYSEKDLFFNTIVINK